LCLHPDVHPADSALHGGAEATRPEVKPMTDATLGTVVVDDLFGFWPVAPTSHCPNADVGILDVQQRNVVLSPSSSQYHLLTVYFGTPNIFITLWVGFVYGTNPLLGTLII
jgi:hypothetical protein